MNLIVTHPQYAALVKKGWQQKFHSEYLLGGILALVLIVMIHSGLNDPPMVQTIKSYLCWMVFFGVVIPSLFGRDAVYKAPIVNTSAIEASLEKIGAALGLEEGEILSMDRNAVEDRCEVYLIRSAEEIIILEGETRSLGNRRAALAACKEAADRKRKDLFERYEMFLAARLVLQWDNPQRHYFEAAQTHA